MTVKRRKLRALHTSYVKWLKRGVEIKRGLNQIGGDLKIPRISFIAPKVKS